MQLIVERVPVDEINGGRSRDLEMSGHDLT